MAKITEVGIRFLVEHSGLIAPKDLEKYPGYLRYKDGQKPESTQEMHSDLFGLNDLDPDEKINIGFQEIKQNLIDELRRKLLEVSPTQFEEPVLDLIRSRGCGTETGRVVHTKAENHCNRNLFYVFVKLKQSGERPEFHIVLSNDVADYVRKNHQGWLKGTSRGGKRRNDSDMRKIDDLGNFIWKMEFAWTRIGSIQMISTL